MLSVFYHIFLTGRGKKSAHTQGREWTREHKVMNTREQL